MPKRKRMKSSWKLCNAKLRSKTNNSDMTVQLPSTCNVQTEQKSKLEFLINYISKIKPQISKSLRIDQCYLTRIIRILRLALRFWDTLYFHRSKELFEESSNTFSCLTQLYLQWNSPNSRFNWHSEKWYLYRFEKLQA